jgi:hypothetical protein
LGGRRQGFHRRDKFKGEGYNKRKKRSASLPEELFLRDDGAWLNLFLESLQMYLKRENKNLTNKVVRKGSVGISG